jgi:HSP20 family protein
MFDEIERMFEQMNRQASEEFGGGMGSAFGRGMEVDVADRDGEYEVTADLPGYETDEIDVQLAGRTLQIEAERETAADESDENYLRRERRRQSTARSVQLPKPVDPEGVTAQYRNGVLTITIPKLEDEGGHTIEVE